MADRIEHSYGTINLETAAKWFQLDEADDGPIWMINLMKYKPVAAYDDDAPIDPTGKAEKDAYRPSAP